MKPYGNRLLIRYKHEVLKERPSGITVVNFTPGKFSSNIAIVEVVSVPEKLTSPYHDLSMSYIDSSGELSSIKEGDMVIIQRGALLHDISFSIEDNIYTINLIDVLGYYKNG